MSRTAALITAGLTAAALATSAVAVPANAEAVTYETKNVKATLPDGGVERASLDIPTGYERDRLNQHTVAFVEKSGAGRVVSINLHPRRDTLRELEAERKALMRRYAGSYREFRFTVNDIDARVRAKWVYTFQAPGTGDTEPFISVYLMRGNRLRVVGKVSEKEHVSRIRDHVVRSVAFPS